MSYESDHGCPAYPAQGEAETASVHRGGGCGECAPRSRDDEWMPMALTLPAPAPLITVEEARALGMRVHSPAYRRVRPGVYIEGRAWESLAGWQRYQVRVQAFTRAHPDAILCLESAAAVHGLPLFGHPRDIHVYDPDRAASRRFGDVAVHTSVDGRAVQLVGGIAVTDVADTVVDLARILPPAHALAVADAAVSPAQGGSLDVDELRGRAAAQCARRGRARLEAPELQREFRYEGAQDRVTSSSPRSASSASQTGGGSTASTTRREPSSASGRRSAGRTASGATATRSRAGITPTPSASSRCASPCCAPASPWCADRDLRSSRRCAATRVHFLPGSEKPHPA